MDAGMLRPLDRFPGFIDIALHGTRQPANYRDLDLLFAYRRIPDLIRDPAHGFQVIGRGGGKARFDNVHAQAGQVSGHFQLLGRCHRRAGGLFAVSQCCIENFHIIIHGYSNKVLSNQ